MSTSISVDDVRKGLPSASGLQRLVLCPGSWLAEQACPEEVESAAAAAGTRLHKHMEDGTLPEDAEEAEAVEWCRKLEADLAREYTGDALVLFRERRLWDACQRLSGKPDVVWAHERTALVLDYKFGRGEVVSAEQNCQLYALALLVFDNFADIEEVYAGILQPFVCRKLPKLGRFTRADVEQLRRWIYGRLDEAARPGAKLCPGEVQCKYCRAAASCPALGLQVQKAAGLELVRWEQWCLEDRRRAWDAARLAKKYVEAIERKVRADLEAGVEIPGLELGAGKASFTIADAGGAFAELNALLEVSGEEFTRCCSVSISKLDKVVHDKLAAQAPEDVKQTTKASKEWLREVLADYGSVKCTAGTIKETTK
ncbi:MAG: DUF2800 domain-containing protein [Akkermansia sp.]|nr:DUF2800 domain-containing protein [Akkermansia sp.]